MDFNSLGLLPCITENLAELGLTRPTPIQTKAIPHAMEGRDILGLAQTGTGKTAAFGLPLLTAIAREQGKPEPKTVRGLVLAPTRELAKQIVENLQAYAKGTHMRVGLVVGGASINAQVNRLARGTDVLVATPGRLIDLLDRRAVTLSQTRFLVLDEADQMLDLGFIHALRRIATLLPQTRQTMLFSATMPKLMAEIAGSYLTDPVRVETAPPGKPADKIEQSVHFIAQGEKTALLIEHLDAHRADPAIVFARTKHGSERLMKNLLAAGYAAVAVHGNKSQGQRDRAIREFREGEAMVLVATDVAARGIDIPGIRYVYNYDLPNVADNYVHRIGRTARAGRDGTAIAYCAPAEMGELRDIQKLLGKELPVSGGTVWSGGASAEQGAGKPKGNGRRGNGGRRRGGKPAGGGERKGNGQRAEAAKPAAQPSSGKAKPARGNRRNARGRGKARAA
ncbi:DEAD/DEAH box helicase [Pseudooceanicola batsensis HTCC2597]|uniref:DEAD/DEAH box helicase n=1 Tax=Pseudooceanicola batsensis (strain ATCC BAA-863 / DSM 15984 / KCTC 12145 / HTCC2597) TaxID=252305 RepID=A3TU52_PSEBH|nr:DEAD/DEAH box helicase [Pseudooceanicola batsensis]EAQ05179.1 DEAD/DEAH box helicase [Pseudooceanicola batsensis HTCC2597]